MPIPIYKHLQQPKPEVPGRRDLLHQIGAQCAAKIRTYRGRQINGDFVSGICPIDLNPIFCPSRF